MFPGMRASLLAGAAGSGGGGGAPVNLNSATIERFVNDPVDATASFSLNSSGQATGTNMVSYNWRLAGASADYDVSFDGGTSWFNLGTTRTISKTRTSVGVSQQTYDVRIRLVATGTEIESATITLYAEVMSLA